MVLKLPSSVKIMEVGPRDGLQNEKIIIDTASKISFIDKLIDAGLKRIEITAFVSPRWIMPLADHREVAHGLKKKAGVTFAALVPNVQGYERAVSSGKIDEISLVIAATDQHNKKNLNADSAQVMERYREVALRARQDKCPFRAYISCVFGCPYEGFVKPDKVLALSKELLDLGAYEISLSDTIGIASPLSTLIMLEALLTEIAEGYFALHMHDTKGRALANIFCALSLGIASFDSSAGGLGGCPYALGASGNVASEDLIAMLESMNIETGICVDKLAEASFYIENILQKSLPSKILTMLRQAR
jgi:hydroxymethylglutaryl-CoA lyase